MKPSKRLNLLEKGWKDYEIKRAEAILDRSEEHDIFFSKIVFWSAMVVIIFANLVVSLVLIPYLIVLNNTTLDAIIVLLAGSIGFLYNLLITDIGQLKRKHHLLAGILIPLLSLFNFFLMVAVSNRFITDLQINNPRHDPWTIGLIFMVSFILPYLFLKTISMFKEARSRKAILARRF